MASILVVDDDGQIREVVRFALARAGHHVTEAKDGKTALEAFAQTEPDVVVLDIVMPELDGLEVCRRIRERNQSVPILFLSSRDDELDRVLGLEIGADDYITKPFSPRELVARVKAILRRSAPAENHQAHPNIQRGSLLLDLQQHRCLWETQELLLTVTEFSIVETLARTPGKVFTRDELVDRAWGLGHAITDRTVDSHIRRIRKKFNDCNADPIETIYGMGYRWKA